jgi:GGDEF domain-containing protein
VELGHWTLDSATLQLARQTETNIRNTSRSNKDAVQVLPMRISRLTADTLTLVLPQTEIEVAFQRIDPESAKVAIAADAVPANTAEKLDQALKDPGFQQLVAGEDGKALQHTAFCNAAALGDTAGVRSFLQQGVEIDRLDSRAPEPRTALIVATKFQQVEVVKLLLDHGAAKSPRDANGKTALDYARELHHEELIALLR